MKLGLTSVIGLCGAIVSLGLLLPGAWAAPSGHAAVRRLGPCTAGAWWALGCVECRECSYCLTVSHWKIVCAGLVILDRIGFELTEECDDGGSGLHSCDFVSQDLPRGTPYAAGETPKLRCPEADVSVFGQFAWNGDTPLLQSLTCLEK